MAAVRRSNSLLSAFTLVMVLMGITVGLTLVFFSFCGSFVSILVLHPEGNTQRTMLTAAGILVGSLLIGIGLLWGTCRWGRYLMSDEYKQVRLASHHANSLASDACPTLELAVRYDGCDGSVHTFVFANPRYAQAFRDANADKVL
jgi:hypothetical protein